MKRWLSVLATVGILFGVFAFAPSAAPPPDATLTFSSPQEVALGDEFSVSFTVSCGDGDRIGAYWISLSYDSTAFALVSGGDASEEGCVLFCDSLESPVKEMTFQACFRALATPREGFSFDRLQVVDFDSALSVPLAFDPVFVSVNLDPTGRGDMDQNGRTDSDDAIHLLFHTLFGSQAYPILLDGDLDQNGSVDSDDAIYLLFFVLFPTSYPLK